MKKVYFTVGPSQVYPTVPAHIARAVQTNVLSESHRGEWFKELYRDVEGGLRRLMGVPQTHSIYFLPSATECMERVIQNVTTSSSGHVLTGAFGKKFYEISVDLGRKALKFEVLPGDLIPEDLGFEKVELIALTQNDTATGYRIPMREVYRIGRVYPSALVALDVVSSVPFVKLNFSKLDLVFFSVQKGFGLPAGLGVLIVGPRAKAVHEKLVASGVSTGSFHNFSNMEKYGRDSQTYETPNVLDIYLLSRVIGDLEKVGIEEIRKSTLLKSELLYSFFVSHPRCSIVVGREVNQSETTIVVEIEGGSKKLLSKLAKKGYIVGAGYGDMAELQIRVANFPAQSVPDVKGLIRAMREILKQ